MRARSKVSGLGEETSEVYRKRQYRIVSRVPRELLLKLNMKVAIIKFYPVA